MDKLPPPRFDADGFLMPSEAPVTVDLAFLAEHFVAPFGPDSARKRLFENYLEFVERLSENVFPYFEQWIDGSFVSQKAEPRDIDVVTFFDARVYEKLKPKFDRMWSDNMESRGIDSYFAPAFAPEHPLFGSQEANWQALFSKIRGEKDRKKGFIRIIFEKEIQ